MLSEEDYSKIVSDQLPYKTKWGLCLKFVEATCSVCKKELVEKKIKFSEFNDVLDIRVYGRCNNCNVLGCLGFTRVYRDGKIVFRGRRNKWIEHSEGFFRKIINKFKKLHVVNFKP